MSKDIRTLRLEKGIRQRDLAEKLGVSVRILSKWERGFEIPDEKALHQLAYILKCNPDTLATSQKEHNASTTPGEGYATARANKVVTTFPRTQMLDSKKLKVLDLFCGAGGLSYGFDSLNEFQVTCGVDLLHDRVRTFHFNHPRAVAIAADIRNLSIEKLAEHAANPDIIVGGPPCQGFSSIRPFRTLTINDNRNSLIEHFLLVVESLRPTWFLFENVVGVLTHNKGIVLDSLLRGLREIGYTLDWRVVNAAYYGLPQNRERVFIVGNSQGKEFSWPNPTNYTRYRSMAGKRAQVINPYPLFNFSLRPAVTVMEAIHDLPEVKAGESNTHYTDILVTEYEREMRRGASTLTLHRATAHSKKMLEIIRLSGTNRSALPENLTSSGFSSSYSRLEPDNPSTTLTVNFVHPASNRCIHPYQDRALTPREGARIQGFPDIYKFAGTRAQIVKQIGNAVPPILARVFAQTIAEQI